MTHRRTRTAPFRAIALAMLVSSVAYTAVRLDAQTAEQQVVEDAARRPGAAIACWRRGRS